jgi:hypothetical protein
MFIWTAQVSVLVGLFFGVGVLVLYFLSVKNKCQKKIYNKGWIKMFKQERHSLSLLHKAVLQCKIFPACNSILTEQFCIIKSVLLSCFAVPFEAVKPYIYIQANVTSVSESCWWKVKREFLLPTAYTAAKSLLCCQTNTLMVAEIQCRFSFVCLQIKLQGARNVTWDSAFRVLLEYHTKARFS